VLTLCLGEALVDLVCERPAADLADAGAFVPHPGGAWATVAFHPPAPAAGLPAAVAEAARATERWGAVA